MEVQFNPRFYKQYRKADPVIQSAFDKNLTLFLRQPLHPRLRNHALAGEFKGYRSINITGDWRAVYIIRKNQRTKHPVAVFYYLGTHSQLYK